MEPVPAATWTLVRSSSCAVGLCIYCSSRKACAGSSWLSWDTQSWVMLSMQAGGIPTCLIQLSPLALRGTTLSLNHGPCVCHSQGTGETLTNTWWPQGGTCSSVAPAATAPLLKIHTPRDFYTLSFRAHSFCVSLILPVLLPLLQVGFLLFFFFSVEAWPWKKDQLDLKCEQRIQAGSWGLGELTFRNQCLQIRVSQVWFLLLMALSAIVSGVTANWGGIKPCLWRAVMSLKWQEPGVPVSRARWTLRYWILQLPNPQFDLHYLFGLIIFTPFWASPAGFCSVTTSESWPFLWKNLFLDNPGQECTSKRFFFSLHYSFV